MNNYYQIQKGPRAEYDCQGCEYLSDRIEQDASSLRPFMLCKKLDKKLDIDIVNNYRYSVVTPKNCPYLSSTEELILFILKDKDLPQSEIIDEVKSMKEDVKISDIVPIIWSLIDKDELKLLDNWKITSSKKNDKQSNYWPGIYKW